MLLRVNDILTDLSRPELTSLPFLSCAAPPSEPRSSTSARPTNKRALLPPSALALKLEFPPVTLLPGELCLASPDSDDVFRQLFQLAQAMKKRLRAL